MRGFFLLVRRDLAQRLPLFVASLAMGLFIAAIPLLTGPRPSPAEIRGAAGLIAALCWSTVLAVLLGGSIFTRDLTENRLAFDFRLPVRAGAIWAARLLAAIVTITLAAAILLAPPAAAGMDWRGASAGLDEWIGHGATNALAYTPLALLALLLLANPIALAARTRSAWMGVDMVSVAMVFAAAYWAIGQLELWGAEFTVLSPGLVLFAFILCGTVLPALLRVRLGRTEVDRAHRSFSLTLLATALLISAGILGISQWMLHPGVRNLAGYSTSAVGLGPDWVQLTGVARRFPRTSSRFLLEPATGRSLRLGLAYWELESAKRSLDGSTLAWMESESPGGDIHRLMRLRLSARELKPSPTQITVTKGHGEWALSPGGRSVATLESLGNSSGKSRLTISVIETGAIETSLILPSCSLEALNFVSERELLISCRPACDCKPGPDSALLIRSIDLTMKTQQVREVRWSPPNYEVAPGYVRGTVKWLRVRRSRAVNSEDKWSLLDAASGGLVIPLELPPTADPGSDHMPTGRQLRDLRYVLILESSALSRLVVLSKEGELEQTIPLPAGTRHRVLAETTGATGVLLGRVAPENGPRNAVQSLTVVDLNTRATRELEGRFRISSHEDLSASETTFVDERKRLLWFDPDSRQLRSLLDEEQFPDDEKPFH